MNTEAIVVGEDHVARLQAIELPPMSDCRVRIRNRLSGVSCGTEADATSGRATYMPRPFVTGYQTVGEVLEVGSCVRTVRPGDMVFTNGGGLWGMTSLAGGSHARELVVNEADVVRLTSNTPSLPTAAYAALAAIAAEGMARMHLVPGQVMLVFGLGMLGQLAGKLAQQQGLRVIGVNRSPWKRERAATVGFDGVCGTEPSEIEQAVNALGFGPAQYAIDLTGSQTIFNTAIQLLNTHGELSLLGYYPEPFTVDFDVCHGKRLSIHNPVGLGEQLPNVIDLIETGRLDVESLIGHRINPNGITAFYEDLVTNHSAYLGVVIDWEAD